MTSNDAVLIVRALRNEADRLRRQAQLRSSGGPGQAEWRKVLRAEAGRCEAIADRYAGQTNTKPGAL